MIHFGMLRALKYLTDRSVGGKRSVGAGGNATYDVPPQNIFLQTVASKDAEAKQYT